MVTLRNKITNFVIAFLNVLFKRILLIVVVVAALVAASFLFTKGFSTNAMSERMIWSGLVIALIAGMLTFGSTTGGRDFGVPGQFTRSAHVESLIQFNIQVRQQLESRFDFRIQMFVAGLLLFGLGALVQRFFG
jgi:ABC-type uncharacterized transport system permease subunit